MKINRFLPLIIPVAVFISAEMFYLWPKMIYISVVLTALLFFFATRQFVIAGRSGERWYNFIILPVMFSLGLFAFSLIVPNRFLVQGLFFLDLVFLYFYFRAIYYFLVNRDKYVANSLENISSYGNFLAFYFLASSIYGLQSFLGLSTWPLMIALLLVIGLIVYQVIWINGIDLTIGFFYIILLCIVLLELAWSISFLTLSYYVLGLILAVYYYILIGMVRFYLLGTLTRKQIKHYVLFGFSSLMAVLLTARWI